MNPRYGPLLLGFAVVSAALAEPPALESVVVEARAEAGGTASVDARYFLEPRGATEVEFTALTFGGVHAANIRAFIGEREISFVARESADGRLDGSVRLPADAQRLALRLTYQVLPAAGGSIEPSTVSIPLLVARWPPRDGLPGTFSATVALPAGTVAYTGFPSDFERIASIDRTSDAAVYSFAMPVMPSLLRLATARGKPPLVTVERAVDLGTVVVLLGLAGLGWRRLRESLG